MLKINIKKEIQYFLNFLSNNKYEITDKNKKQNINKIALTVPKSNLNERQSDEHSKENKKSKNMTISMIFKFSTVSRIHRKNTYKTKNEN